MAITFKRAPVVEVGDAITSTQFAGLAEAFNDRLRSGLGDACFRIHFWWLSLLRQVRNPDSSGFAFPPQDEFREVYQGLDPQHAEWPATGPGDPEGANVSNPMMAFVFGAVSFDLFSESERFADLVFAQAEPSPTQAWALAKQQRGAVDPVTGALASPSFDVARSHFRIGYAKRSPFGNSYGGWLPQPELAIDGCEDADPGDDVPAPTNYVIKFTSLVDGAVRTYPGTCQPAIVEQYPDHVAYVAEYPWAYYVFLNDGTVEVLLTGEWVEGPYTGESKLGKVDGGHLQRILHNFAREFRGSAGQVAQEDYHLAHAFDFHRFFTGQYLLAPAIGVQEGDMVQEHYPIFEIADDAPAGTFLLHEGQDGHLFYPSFMAATALITGDGIVGSLVVLEVVDNGAVVETVTVEVEGGAVEKLWLASTPWAPGVVGWRLRDAIEFSSGTGFLRVEMAELFPYRPQVHDAAMLIRASAAIASQPDGIGAHDDEAELLSDDYFRLGGCILNRAGLPGVEGRFTEVNTNAVFDAMRRWSRMVRVPHRREFIGYAVEDGKSVLWFRRHPYGLDGTTPIDQWADIGPSEDALVSGDIREGYEYEVRGENVTYSGTLYHDGDRFVGTTEVAFYGDGEVYEANGIRHTATPHDYTNEWLLGVEFIPYHPSQSSLWKSDSFGDYFALPQRCHFYSPDIANDTPTLWHFAFGQRVSLDGVVNAEAPSGYNYANLAFAYLGENHANQLDCDPMDTACIEYRQKFYKSCRVYEPDVEIEKVEHDGDGIVKVTLTGRLHHHDTLAPASLDRDIGTWDLGDLKTEAEDYRTVENGLREYLVNQNVGTQCDHTAPGNAGINSAVQLEADAPYGTCYPKFRLTKLIPVPADDGNDAQNAADTKFQHDTFTQMELYLRCMCEGYVDGQTSADYACEHGTLSVFDFTYESLCVQANGNRWMTAFTTEDRPDNPQGFGPMPNTVARAEVFNGMARAVNLLTSVRVMLPGVVECYIGDGEASTFVQAFNGDATAATCVSDTTPENVWVEIEPDYPPVDMSSPVWGTCADATIVLSAGLTGDCDGGGLHEFRVQNQAVVFRWRLVDPDAEETLPASWRDMLESNATFLVEINELIGHSETRTYTTDIGEADECDGQTWDVGDGRFLQFPTNPVNTVTCSLAQAEFTLPSLFKGHATRAYNSGGGGTVCGLQMENRYEIALLSSDVPMITVPLED